MYLSAIAEAATSTLVRWPEGVRRSRRRPHDPGQPWAAGINDQEQFCRRKSRDGKPFLRDQEDCRHRPARDARTSPTIIVETPATVLRSRHVGCTGEP